MLSAVSFTGSWKKPLVLAVVSGFCFHASSDMLLTLFQAHLAIYGVYGKDSSAEAPKTIGPLLSGRTANMTLWMLRSV